MKRGTVPEADQSFTKCCSEAVYKTDHLSEKGYTRSSEYLIDHYTDQTRS
jgi:hypothetical protein